MLIYALLIHQALWNDKTEFLHYTSTLQLENKYSEYHKRECIDENKWYLFTK